jgi:hypothetical protein
MLLIERLSVGCDIHLFIERRPNPSAPWEVVTVQLPCRFCRTIDPAKAESKRLIVRNQAPLGVDFEVQAPGTFIDGEKVWPDWVPSELLGPSVPRAMQQGGEPLPCYWCKGTGIVPSWQDRNYAVFAMLANVRNHHGDSDEERFDPISEPRGLPDDMSDTLKEISGRHYPEQEDGESDEDFAQRETAHEQRLDAIKAKYGATWLGEHSESWVTLEELQKYRADKRNLLVKESISVEEYLVWDRKGPPHRSYANLSGPAIVTVTQEEFEAWRSLVDIPEMAALSAKDRELAVAGYQRLTIGGKPTHVRVQWYEPYDAFGREFWEDFVEKALPKLGDPDRVRLVFGFDS